MCGRGGADGPGPAPPGTVDTLQRSTRTEGLEVAVLSCSRLFVEISFRSGLERTGVVGGCHRTDCSHNTKLECTAAAVQVGAAADKADCLTSSPR